MLKRTIRFKAKPVRIGKSYGVIIPKPYFDNELIKNDREYTFEVVS